MALGVSVVKGKALGQDGDLELNHKFDLEFVLEI